MSNFASPPGYSTSQEAALLTQLFNLTVSPPTYAIAKTNNGFTNIAVGGSGSGSMVYPSAGIALSNGSAWLVSISGTSSQFVKGDGTLDSNTYGSGTVTSVGLSSTNGTLTIGSTPVTTSGTITADLNLAHANTWTATQTFSNATYSALFTGGNVGIGTTAPGSKLTVAGDIAVGTNNVIFDGINLQEKANASSYVQLAVQPNSGNKDAVFQFAPSGSNTSSVMEFYNTNVLGSLSRAIFKITNTNFKIGPDATTLPIDFIQNNVAKMRIDTNGNVGIGTTGPTQKLEVSGGVLQDTFTASGTNAYGLQINAPTGATNNYAASFMGGNIGIGTTSPNAKTEILATTEQLRLSYDATHYSSFTVNSAGDLTLVGGTTAKLTATTFVGALTGTSDKTNALNSATTVVNVSSATAPTSGQVLTATSGTAATWQTPASFSYPGAGITVSTGSAWGTSLTAPSGAIVGTSDTQALTNKDLTGAGNTFPTFNQNTTGSSAKWTTARNLAGNSVDGSANVAFANKFIVQGTTDSGLSGAQFLGALGTGIVKNTTTTGVLSIAIASDFPTLNQNTTGSAGSVTGLSVTSGKTLTVSNSLTLTATDGSTLAIGTGGTLGTAAYTASTAYDVAGAAAAVTPTTLGLVIGTNVQAYNSNLTAINQALTTTSSPSFTTVTAALSGNATTATNLTGLTTSVATLNNQSGTNTGDQNIFASVVVSGQTTVTTPSTTQALTLVAGTNVTLTTDNTAKSVTINSTATGGISWTNVTGTTQTASVNNGYVANNASLVTFTLPSTASVGDIVRVAGAGAGGWKIAQNASGYINFGNKVTTTGTGGSLASVNQYDAVELICIVANNGWSVISSQGNITIV